MAKRIEITKSTAVQTFTGSGGTANVKVVGEKSGDVTWLDRAKGYYHTLITLVGAVLVLLNQATPVFSFLPENWHGYVSVAIVFLTAAANFLKQNEQWVNDL